jgi:hypothetical protein
MTLSPAGRGSTFWTVKKGALYHSRQKYLLIVQQVGNPSDIVQMTIPKEPMGNIIFSFRD